MDFRDYVEPNPKEPGGRYFYRRDNDIIRPGDAKDWYFYQRDDGAVISFYPIVPGLLNLPVHLLARAVGKDVHYRAPELGKITAAFSVAISAVFLWFTLLRLCATQEAAAIGVAVYVLATHAWSTASQGLWQHGPSLMFLIAALYFLILPGARRTALAGLALGFAVWNRPTNVLIALPLAVYVLANRPRELLALILAAALPLSAMAWYSWAVWGSLLSLGQGACNPKTGLVGAVGFHASPLVSLPAMLFSPARGLFVYSPVLILALPFWPGCWQRNRVPSLVKYLGAGSLLILALFSKWDTWEGGWTFGYRYLIEMLPALILFLAFAWEQWIRHQRWACVLFCVLVLVSIYVQMLGAFAFPTKWNADNSLALRDRVWQVPDFELTRCHAKLWHLPGPK